MDDNFRIVDELQYNITKANDLYRVGEDPLIHINGVGEYITDQRWDEMVDDLEHLMEPSEFKTFRELLFGKAGKVTHKYPIGSLRKTKAEDNSLPKWLTTRSGGLYHVSSKVDGLSMVLDYRDGVLVDAVTRGDGAHGVSQFEKIKHIVPTTISGMNGQIRGEVTLTFDSFEELCKLENKDYANLRNASVGVVNRGDASIEAVKLLTFVAYRILGVPTTVHDQFKDLAEMGFNTPIYNILTLPDTDNVIECMVTLFKEFKDRENFEIDGLVIHDESKPSETVLLPTNTIAFKINTAYTSKAIGIESNLSMNGLMKPVLLIEPTEIAGTMVSRATLHNYENVAKLYIHYGDEIELQKSGEIIPYILDVRTCETSSALIPIPTVCPHCATELRFESVDLKCFNTNCKKQIQLQLVEFLKRIGVANVAEKSIAKFGIGNFDDLLNWKPNPKYKSETKFYGELKEKVFTSSPEELLSCMVFDGLGKSTIEKLLESYSLVDLIGGVFESLPDGIGDITMNNFYQTSASNYKIVETITNDERFTLKEEAPKVVGGLLDGLTFCITGNLESMSRDEAFKMVVSHGADTRTSVSSKLSYLVNNDIESMSGKNKKAKSLGIPIINEVQLLAMVSEKDNTCGNLFDM
jgi:DNA ligase (NAD+)